MSLGAAGLLVLSGLLLAEAEPVGAKPETIEHVVQPGETLWSIAARSSVYSDPYLWPVIYRFNRDQIKDPGHIYPRQRLQIPIQIDAETRRDSRREAGAQRPDGGS